MRNSSKKDDFDLHVRIGVLEKLVERLSGKVIDLEVSLTKTTNDLSEVIKVVNNTNYEKDEWATPAVTEDEDPQKNDEVSKLMDN